MDWGDGFRYREIEDNFRGFVIDCIQAMTKRGEEEKEGEEREGGEERTIGKDGITEWCSNKGNSVNGDNLY